MSDKLRKALLKDEKAVKKPQKPVGRNTKEDKEFVERMKK